MTSKVAEEYLLPTYFIDSDSETVTNLAKSLVKDLTEDIDKAKAIFYWVRDEIRYDPYAFSLDNKADFKASAIIKKGASWCVPKACVLAALSRAVGIPSCLHFADIRNYQITDKLFEEMGTNVFVFHGYTELFINGKWIKATPTFNIELCSKFGLKTVEFDGVNDGMLPAESLDGQKYVEYLKDRGFFADLPFDQMISTYEELHATGLLDFSQKR